MKPFFYSKHFGDVALTFNFNQKKHLVALLSSTNTLRDPLSIISFLAMKKNSIDFRI